jgi:ABC-type uncharacterized transport system permease subunit
MLTLLALFAMCTYLANSAVYAKAVYQHDNQHKPPYLATLAVCAHGVYVAGTYLQHDGFDFSFFSTASFVALIVALLLVLAALSKPVEKLGIVLFPIAALMLGLKLFTNDSPRLLHHHNWAMNLHILTSIIAFSLLNIAALQAILLAIQNQHLKSHPPKRFIQLLPALQTMEALLFQMLAVGVFFLSISLLSGFVFLDDLFAQHLAHKTILSMLAWLIFSGLLLGRSIYGWRGVTAIRWTLCGFVLLLLGYFGSKLVLELILHR